MIGGGWAARFVLAGCDVRVYDPDPQADRKLGEVLDGARAAWAALTSAPLPAEGGCEVVGSVADAVTGAAFVQESAPENPEVVQERRRRPGDACGAAGALRGA